MKRKMQRSSQVFSVLFGLQPRTFEVVLSRESNTIISPHKKNVSSTTVLDQADFLLRDVERMKDAVGREMYAVAIGSLLLRCAAEESPMFAALIGYRCIQELHKRFALILKSNLNLAGHCTCIFKTSPKADVYLSLTTTEAENIND